MMVARVYVEHSAMSSLELKPLEQDFPSVVLGSDQAENSRDLCIYCTR